MNMLYADEIRLDSNGNPDLDYYVTEAKRMRSEMMASMVDWALTGIRELLEKAHVLPHRPPLHG